MTGSEGARGERYRPPMEESLLHRGLMRLNRLNDAPAGLILALLLLLALAATLPWALTAGLAAAQTALGLLLAGMALDAAVLLSLPARAISFGPWRGQLLALALPRAVITALLGFLGAWGTVPLFLHTAAQLAGTLLLLRGAIVEPSRVGLTRLELAMPGWPADAPPLTVLHISDLHVERLGVREAAVVDLVAAYRPDLVLCTGDYVSLSNQRDPETLQAVTTLLAQLTGRLASFAVLGTPLVDLPDTVPAAIGAQDAVRLLRNERVLFDAGHGRRLTLLGQECTHHLPTDQARLAQLAGGRSEGVPAILLYHSPELMPQAAGLGLHLYLCGHTHGGQVRLPGVGPLLTSSQLGRRYVMGLYHEGGTRLYVSRGVGLEGGSAPRVRLLAPPEIALITLTPAPN